MTKTINTLIKVLIIIGVIGVAMVMLFGNNTSTYLNRTTIEGTAIVWYKFDFHKYIEKLLTEITNTTVLELKLPTRHWYHSIDITNWGDVLANNLAVILDYVILIINVLLYPLKVGGYLINFFLALMGINTGNESSLHWLGAMSNVLIQIEIPYV